MLTRRGTVHGRFQGVSIPFQTGLNAYIQESSEAIEGWSQSLFKQGSMLTFLTQSIAQVRSSQSLFKQGSMLTATFKIPL